MNKNVILIAGAIIAFTIGSGFATGQEIMQYYTAYGVNSILVVLTFLILFMYYNFNFALAGVKEKFNKGNDVFYYFCGKKIGVFFDYYSTVFCYMSFWVMIGGAASTLYQQYGFQLWIGAVLLTILAAITVVGGLQRLLRILGIIGPLIAVICIIIGIITCFRDWGSFSSGLEAIKTGKLLGTTEGGIKSAGDNWFVSGCSYAGFVLLWFASFMSQLGTKNKKEDLKKGIILGTIVICTAIIISCFAQIANINTSINGGNQYLWEADIPNLILASKIWRPLSTMFSVIIFAGIYTTAVPLLYNPVQRFSNEGTLKFKVMTLLLAIIGLIVGLKFPFRILLNIIYVINGYAGSVLILFIIAKNLKTLVKKEDKHC